MNNHDWNQGPPPHVGWWLTQLTHHQRTWQRWTWWTGCSWQDLPQAHFVQWSNYYPEGARVPRVDPGDPRNGWLVHLLNNGSPYSVDVVWKVIRKREEMDAMTPEERDAARAQSRTVREMKKWLPPRKPFDVKFEVPTTEQLTDAQVRMPEITPEEEEEWRLRSSTGQAQVRHVSKKQELYVLRHELMHATAAWVSAGAHMREMADKVREAVNAAGD